MIIFSLKAKSVNSLGVLSISFLLVAIVHLTAIALAETISKSPVMEITAHENMISVVLVDAPLIDVLKRIKQEAGFKAHLYGDLSEPVTMSFAKISMDTGLRRLTNNHSLSLIYHRTSNPLKQEEIKHIAEVWVFSGSSTGKVFKQTNTSEMINSSGHSNDMANLSQQSSEQSENDEQEIVLLSQVLNNPYAKLSSQQQAVRSLADVGDSAAVMAMAAFLGNDDKELRQLLVDGIGSVQDARSTQILGQVIYSEPDPEIRMMAVRALADRQNHKAAHALLRGVLNDPDEEVRNLADQLLIKKYE